jgi:hypothetical protein
MTVEVVPEPRADVATRVRAASKNPVPNGTERLIIGSSLPPVERLIRREATLRRGRSARNRGITRECVRGPLAFALGRGSA